MAAIAVVDTGYLVALLRERDVHRSWAAAMAEWSDEDGLTVNTSARDPVQQQISASMSRKAYLEIGCRRIPPTAVGGSFKSIVGWT